ncbi:MAG: hypothetical protein IJ190_12770 [Prevotella sp.]|nr:hypothetical protein [Prevotella sp.]
MKKIFTLLVTALVLGTGSVMATIVTSISDNASWKAFVSSVNSGDDYSSTIVKLTADVVVDGTVSETTVGTSSNKFNGVFDGQGFTLTFNKTGITGLSNVAPFQFISDATIKNLKTAGKLDANKGLMAGIVSEASGTSTITNCTSSMDISCTVSEDATNGGILARGDNGANTTITNCAYVGTLTAESGVSGIVGYFRNGSSATFTLKNVLFAGTIKCTGTSNIRNIYRASNSGTTGNMYYITKGNGTADDGTAATSKELLNGQLAYNLASADDTNNTLFWGQGNLNRSNVDAYPSLTNDPKKKVVQVNINGMSTTPFVNPGGAAPNPCRFGKTGFKLSSGDAYSLETMPTEGDTFTYGTSKLETTTGMYCITLPAAAMTIVLPFDCDLPSGITAYDISYTSGDKVTATSVTKITANKPVLINGTAGAKYKFEASSSFGGTYAGTLTDGVKAHTNGVLTGVYVDANASSGYNPIAYVPENSYVLQNGASGLGFYKVKEANKIKITSFRAYATFDYSGSREFLGIDINGNTTGINEMKTQETNNAPVYSLSGQRVGSDYKGVVIQNGKKFVVK